MIVTHTQEAIGSIAQSVPKVIGTRTSGLEPLLEIWKRDHPSSPWSKLIDRALKKELAPLAGKRYAHLIGASEEA